jgi:hypothetical protein
VPLQPGARTNSQGAFVPPSATPRPQISRSLAKE